MCAKEKTSKRKEVTLGIQNFIPKGSVLRNAESVVGVCVYTGHHTKIMLNSCKSRVKYSTMERYMNR